MVSKALATREILTLVLSLAMTWRAKWSVFEITALGTEEAETGGLPDKSSLIFDTQLPVRNLVSKDKVDRS